MNIMNVLIIAYKDGVRILIIYVWNVLQVIVQIVSKANSYKMVLVFLNVIKIIFLWIIFALNVILHAKVVLELHIPSVWYVTMDYSNKKKKIQIPLAVLLNV